MEAGPAYTIGGRPITQRLYMCSAAPVCVTVVSVVAGAFISSV